MKGVLVLLLGAFAFSCGESSSDGSAVPITGQAILVLCEGNFGATNSTLSLLDTVLTDTIHNDVFRKVNNRGLGEYAHSMTVHDSLCYIAVFGSDRIEVIHERTFKHQATIANVSSPRDVIVSGGALFVSSYADSAVIRYSTATFQKLKTVKLSHKPDRLAASSGIIFVSSAPNSRDTLISYFDEAMDQPVQEISLSRSPICLATDKAGQYLYAGCDSAGYIAKIDVLTRQVLTTFGSGVRFQGLALHDSLLACITSTGDIRLYNVGSGTLTRTLTNATGNYRSVSFGNGELYAVDAIDFLSPGELTRFSEDFKIRQIYEVGRAPIQVLFTQ